MMPVREELKVGYQVFLTISLITIGWVKANATAPAINVF